MKLPRNPPPDEQSKWLAAIALTTMVVAAFAVPIMVIIGILKLIGF